MALFDFNLEIVPDIDFCVKDASLIQSDVLTKYDNIFYLVTQINKTLGRSDPVRLFLMTIIYQLVVQRSVVDSTGKQNLIKYSKGDNLDNVGARWGPRRGRRLQAQKARTTLRFSLRTTLATDVIVAFGMVAQSNEGLQFSTTREGIITAGSLFVDVPAEAVNAGRIANGLVAGQITELVTWNQTFVVLVTNTVTTSGGSDRETDDRFRIRVWMAPESFSVAGPYGAYDYWIASTNAEITDARSYGDPRIEGEVWLYFVMENARLPTDIEKDQVMAVCNADDNRPLTDFVSCPDLTTVPFTVNATFYIDDTKALFAEDIRAGVMQAYADYLLWQQSEINLDIIPNEMTKRLLNAGAKRVDYAWNDPMLPHTGYTAIPPANFLGMQIASLDPASPGLVYGGLEPR
jgi:phage-related baseplate assembly protein